MSEFKDTIQFRYLLVVTLMVLAVTAILIKAGFIMFVENSYWNEVANRYENDSVSVKPTRGNILSSDGKLVASSLPEYKLFMDFKAGGEKKDSLLLAHINDIAAGMHKAIPSYSRQFFKNKLLDGRKRQARYYPIYPHRISYNQFKEITSLPLLNRGRFTSGLTWETFNQRKKPFGSLAKRTLGDMYPDITQGAKNGLELYYDSILKGKEGIARRRKIKNKYLSITKEPAINGSDIITTIDVNMQDICEKAVVDNLKKFNANVGVAILMEVETGEIKAIVNMTKVGNGTYQEIKNNAISDLYEPGSTFKTASLMVALEDGMVDMNDGVDTGNGVKRYANRIMKDHNAHRGGYGYLTVPEILMFSSNIGISTIIHDHYDKKRKKFVEGIKKLGILDKLELDIHGVGTPTIKNPDDPTFSNTDLPWMSMGYGSQIPAINMVTFYNTIANNGTMVKPRLVKAIMENGRIVKEIKPEILRKSVASRSTITKIQEILERTISEGIGKPAGSDQFKVAGKTGTAQIAKGSRGYKSGPMEYLLSFCGYFPADNPKYSCIVSIQNTGGPAAGGLIAGTAFKKIAERVYAHSLRADVSSAKDTVNTLYPQIKKGELNLANYVLKEVKQEKPSMEKPNDGKYLWGRIDYNNESKSVELSPTPVQEKVIPDVRGMGARDAVYLLERLGLRVQLNGIGHVTRQSLLPGSNAGRGRTIVLTLN